MHFDSGVIWTPKTHFLQNCGVLFTVSDDTFSVSSKIVSWNMPCWREHQIFVRNHFLGSNWPLNEIPQVHPLSRSGVNKAFLAQGLYLRHIRLIPLLEIAFLRWWMTKTQEHSSLLQVSDTQFLFWNWWSGCQPLIFWLTSQTRLMFSSQLNSLHKRLVNYFICHQLDSLR